MSINGALQVGRSALAASQAGLQVAGNNMANATTPGYTRQVLHLDPARGESVGRGHVVGLGVRMAAVERQVDLALQARLRDAIASEQEAVIDQRYLAAIESLQGELTDNDLSTLLSDFFNGFSELANNPEDQAVRAVVIQQGAALADRVAQLHADTARVREEIDRDLGASVEIVDGLLGDLAAVNLQIAQAEGGVGVANDLRDRRDQLVTELATHMDLSTVERRNGAVDVFVGSIPVVFAGESRGVELRTESVEGQLQVSVRLKDDGSRLDLQSGRLGALLEQREKTVDPALADLDEFASQLIYQVNRLHAQGQGTHGLESIASAYPVDDPAANLNAADANLPFRVENGSFFIHMTHAESGVRTAHQINVDGDAMSLDDLVNEINAVVDVPNLTAGIDAGGALTLQAASGYEFSFSDDSSGALAALGVNTFFTGRSAADIQVNAALESDPGLLAAGSGHVPGSNGTALALANLQDRSVDELGGRSLREFWQQATNDLAVRAGAARTAVESSQLVRESLAAQVQAVSGVSLDEEAINLLSFQRQFQAAARFLTVIDETLQTLLSIA